jgi:hypothetical protein
MAHTVDHAARREPAPTPDAPGWTTLAASGVGLLALGIGLTVLGARTTSWPGAVLFIAWFVVTITWADTLQRRLPWVLSIPVGLVLLVAASVLPSRSLPPYDAASFGAALGSSVGVGLALGPVVSAVGHGLRRLRRR